MNHLTLELRHGTMRVSVPIDLAPPDIARMEMWLAGLVAASAVQAECYVPTKKWHPHVYDPLISNCRSCRVCGGDRDHESHQETPPTERLSRGNTDGG